jgi:hypothetical protein
MTRWLPGILPCLAALAGCSSFNTLGPCDQTGVALMEVLAVRDGTRPDIARLQNLMTVTTPEEVSAGYNQRTCRAQVSAFGETHDITYSVRQSEGVQGWFRIELPPDTGVTALSARLEAAYGS